MKHTNCGAEYWRYWFSSTIIGIHNKPIAWIYLGEYAVRGLLIQELVQEVSMSKAQIHWQLFFLCQWLLAIGSLFLHCGWEHKLRSSGVPSTTSIIDDWRVLVLLSIFNRKETKERWKCAIFGVFTKFWLKQLHWRSRKQNQENAMSSNKHCSYQLKLITIYNVSWTTACNYMIANKSTSNHSVLTVTCILGHFGRGLYEPKKETNNCIITWMSRELWTIISHSKSQTSESDH